MRVKLTFKGGRNALLPADCNYFLTFLIYDLLRTSGKNLLKFLSEKDHLTEGRDFNLFTFSQLIFTRKWIKQGGIVNLGDRITWLISSPIKEFIRHIINELFQRGVVQIEKVSLYPEDVETLPEPEFCKREYFTCLSPLTMSVNGKYYLSMDEAEEFSHRICEDLIQKYRLLYGSDPHDRSLKVEFDQEYLDAHPHPSRLIDLKGLKVRGYMVPFYAYGSTELMRVGYECGFGDKNSAGFGMVKREKRSSQRKRTSEELSFVLRY
jgi:CRISPR-associated endoribonuclease Cas6